MLNIGIRVDAGGNYGFGHLSRMGALAEAIMSNVDNVVVFYTKTTQNIMHSILPTDYHILYYEQHKSEWEIMNDMANECHVIIMDRKEWYEHDDWVRFKKNWPDIKIVFIDIPWARPDECDLLVFPNIHNVPFITEDLVKLFGEDRIICGGNYVLMRKDILQMRPIRYKNREPWIVFVAGGSDPDECLQIMYNMSSSIPHNLANVRRVFCIGEDAKPFAPYNIDHKTWITGFHPDYLARASLVVTLFGVTPYECIYLETPCLTTGHNNQNSEASMLLDAATNSAAKFMPQIQQIMREEFLDTISSLWNNYSVRQLMSYNCHGLLSPYGPQNLAEKILEV